LPKIYRLGEYAEALEGVALIVGEGLCSNIYVVGREKATVIDTGVGNILNPVWPQLSELGVEPSNVDKVVLTHAHHDHAMGAFLILERAGPKVYVHEEDTRYIASRLGDSLVKVQRLLDPGSHVGQHEPLQPGAQDTLQRRHRVPGRILREIRRRERQLRGDGGVAEEAGRA
jgi:glyoxylase-like metal-dependent hydrolase (beta-lactamase superfamily II)